MQHSLLPHIGRHTHTHITTLLCSLVRPSLRLVLPIQIVDSHPHTLPPPSSFFIIVNSLPHPTLLPIITTFFPHVSFASRSLPLVDSTSSVLLLSRPSHKHRSRVSKSRSSPRHRLFRQATWPIDPFHPQKDNRTAQKVLAIRPSQELRKKFRFVRSAQHIHT